MPKACSGEQNDPENQEQSVGFVTVSVELLATALALVRTWTIYSATTEFWQSMLGAHESSSCKNKSFYNATDHNDINFSL